MRIIKFRAWDKKNKEMIHTSDAFINNYGIAVVIYDNNNWSMTSFRKGDGTDICDEETGELMQYTGYKMFNEEVYFDDLVSNNYGTDKEVIRKIVLFEGNMMMERVKGNSRLPKRIPLHDHHELNYKVIGNIYENSEIK